MKNIRSIAVLLVATLLCYFPSTVKAEGDNRENFIGPAVTIGNGQSILGVEGKFSITDNIAVRPSFSFANLAGAGVTVFGGSATYDLNTDNSQFIPFVGLGVNIYTVEGKANSTSTTGFAQAGVDINLNPGLAVTGDLKVPFDSSSVFGTVLTIGGGYRF